MLLLRGAALLGLPPHVLAHQASLLTGKLLRTLVKRRVGGRLASAHLDGLRLVGLQQSLLRHCHRCALRRQQLLVRLLRRLEGR